MDRFSRNSGLALGVLLVAILPTWSWSQQPVVEAKTWRERGDQARKIFDYRDALKCYTEAINLFEKNSTLATAPSHSATLLVRAEVFRQLGEFDAATVDCDKAIEIAHAITPKEMQMYAIAMGNNSKGSIARSRGDFDSAQALYETALLTFKRLGKTDKEIAALNNLGINDQKKGDLGNARKRLEQALATIPQNAIAEIAVFRHNLGGVLDTQGEFNEARQEYLRALELEKTDRKFIATVYSSLGMLELNVGNPKEAIGYFEKAIEERKAIFGTAKANPQIALNKQNLGRALLDLGDLVSAREITESAITDQQATYGAETAHTDLCKSYLLLSKIWFKNGKFDESIANAKKACELFRRAFPSRSYPHGHFELADALDTLGRFQLLAGRSDLALDSLIQSSRMRVELTTDFAFTASEAELRQYLSAKIPSPNALLDAMRLERWEPQKQYESILALRRIAQRTIANRNQLLHKNIGQSEAFARYLAVRRRLTFSARIEAITDGSREALLEELKSLSSEKERIERQLADEIKSRTSSDVDVSLQDLMASLSKEVAAVDVLEVSELASTGNKRQYIGFVITAQQVSRVDFGESEPINEACRRWLRSLANPADITGEENAAVLLKRTVWNRLVSGLPEGIQHIYLCPDGALSQIPWSAMLIDSQTTRLLDRYDVSLVPYVQMLFEKDVDKQETPKNVLLVGDIEFGASKWAPLPGTAVELDAISSLFKMSTKTYVTLLRSKAATVENVDQYLPQSTIAHFATHGEFEPTRFVSQTIDRNPLITSSLVVASTENDSTESRLTGEQIAGLDLRKLQLVTLSACETGRGQLHDGDGVYGLQQAFHIGGAKSVVASQWRIDDRQTVTFMKLFYEQMLRNKLRPALALSAAQKTMRNTRVDGDSANRGATDLDNEPKGTVGKSAQCHPFYWAAFQHSGR